MAATTNAEGLALLAGLVRKNNPNNKSLTDNVVKFFVRVITEPIDVSSTYADLLLSDNFIEPPFEVSGGRLVHREEPDPGSHPRLVFMGKILRTTNGLKPHIFLDDPCSLASAGEQDIQYLDKLISLHTLFISEAGSYGVTPKFGDVVSVTLGQSDFQGPELKVATFSEVSSTQDSELYNYESSVQCDSLKARLFLNTERSTITSGQKQVLGPIHHYSKKEEDLGEVLQEDAAAAFSDFFDELSDHKAADVPSSPIYIPEITSTRRSVKHQFSLWLNNDLPAAKPCYSDHQYGYAIDMKFRIPMRVINSDTAKYGAFIPEGETSAPQDVWLCTSNCKDLSDELRTEHKKHYKKIQEFANRAGLIWPIPDKSWTYDPVHFAYPSKGNKDTLKQACKDYYYPPRGDSLEDWPSDMDDVVWPIETGVDPLQQS